nr:hypothetical protein [uncultured Mediterranean phage uvMED]BAR26560.1 hypothetical protein [uncultured Mediterranean phage uvMED]BAR26645.1 hypothetical protein [uncultured Mediterranean phage uvMED]BAR26699.1 hypothetical protein [uncultured Mediterranean phage uvMED]BAR26752.1 hypothetical protein [uncultured Mediterranean phage uvMED]
MNPDVTIVMASKKIIKDFINKEDLRATFQNDPYELLAEFALENIRLRKEITKCKCK